VHHATSPDAWAWAELPAGVTTRTTRLEDDELGCYAHDEREIMLDDRLSSVVERCTLAHEIVHAERGDLPLDGSPDGPRLEVRQERRVHAIAAARLVAIDALAEALARTHSLAEAAEELAVDEDTLWHRLEDLTEHESSLLQARVDAIEEGSWPTT
jgi:Zn-dependent peptidase ImmA (M78 family)